MFALQLIKKKSKNRNAKLKIIEELGGKSQGTFPEENENLYIKEHLKDKINRGGEVSTNLLRIPEGKKRKWR